MVICMTFAAVIKQKMATSHNLSTGCLGLGGRDLGGALVHHISEVPGVYVFRMATLQLTAEDI